MRVTLEMPLGTLLRIKALVKDLETKIASKDPLCLAIKTELEQRGVDLTKIKIV